MAKTLVNPLDEGVQKPRQPAPRLDELEGRTLALLDISKPRGASFSTEWSSSSGDVTGLPKSSVRRSRRTRSRPPMLCWGASHMWME